MASSSSHVSGNSGMTSHFLLGRDIGLDRVHNDLPAEREPIFLDLVGCCVITLVFTSGGKVWIEHGTNGIARSSTRQGFSFR